MRTAKSACSGPGYIDQPVSLYIHFLGDDGWVRGVTPKHGENAAHRAIGDTRMFAHEPVSAERLTLPFGFSAHRYAAPWYFGVSRGMALAFVFRGREGIRFTQSPNGGGDGNPEWDFRWFFEQPQVGRRYQMAMRTLYVPYRSHEQMRRLLRTHAAALARCLRGHEGVAGGAQSGTLSASYKLWVGDWGAVTFLFFKRVLGIRSPAARCSGRQVGRPVIRE